MDTIEIDTPYGTARIVAVNDGYFAIYVPWREAGGSFNPRLGTHIGQDKDETRCRKAIESAVDARLQQFPR